MVPQFFPCAAQVVATHGSVPHTPALQVCPEGHDPQSRIPPQSSESVPQVCCCVAQVVFSQVQVLSAAQVSGALHDPQSMVLPQPSLIVPHRAFAEAQLSGRHPQILGTSTPQLSGAVQVPQEIVLPQ
jgi:hypothetical protein